MEPPATLPTEERLREALRSVDDPEIGMNIVDLGLVYRVDITPEHVCIDLTMTTPACPMGDYISDNARRAVSAVLPDGVGVDVALVWEPPWTPEMMSASAKESLGWDG